MSPTIKKAYADTPSGQIHYRYVIPPNPNPQPLIFLHKSASSSASMVRLMTIFSSAPRNYACYAPDMPGFGGSFDPSPTDEEAIEQRGTEWYCSLYVDFFKSLGIWKETGVHLLGHHSGASLAPQLATISPAVVKSVCLIGASIMDAAERKAMRDKFLVPFNTPEPLGSHLLKTWQYLGRMGVTSAGAGECPTECSEEDLKMWQRELIDHVRAWKGRLQIYGAVWARDSEGIFLKVKCPICVMCAPDDVLYGHMDNAKRLRPGDSNLVVKDIKGANFSVDRDVEGIVETWEPFVEKAST